MPPPLALASASAAAAAPPPVGGGRSTLGSAFLLLFTSAAGAGLLSYPFAALHQGLLLNAALTGAFAACNFLTDASLLQTAALFRASRALRECTFEELCFRALGHRAYVAGVVIIVVGVFGALVGYSIVVGDMLEPVAQHLCGGDACAYKALASRGVLIPAFALLVALPLSSLKRLHALAWSNVLAAASVLAVAALVASRGAGRLGGGDVTAATVAPPGSAAANSAADAPLVLARFQAVGILLGVPISIFSLGNHSQVVASYCDLAPAQQRLFLRPLLGALFACVALYVTCGVCGYAAFRDATRGDVLLNFPVGADALADAAKALLGVHIMLAYPVLLTPARWSIATLLRATAARGGSTAAAAAGSDEQARGGAAHLLAARVVSAFATSTLLQSALLVSASALLAVLAPQVSVVFGLVGSTVATAQIYILPGLCLLKWAEVWASEAEGSAGGAALDDADERDGVPLLGLTTLAAGTAAAAGEAEAAALAGPYSDGWLDSDRERVWRSAAAVVRRADALEAAGRSAGDDAEAALVYMPSYLSRSPAVLRAQAYFLLALGTFVMVASTAIYIWSTWFDS